MPNHWHLLLWPEGDGDLATFMQRLTITHVRRWQQHRGYVGLGHVYQGRYKSFPVESDAHFWVVARYVERNALRADLVLRAEEWRWSSLWRRDRGTKRSERCWRLADRHASELAQAGQSKRRRGTGCTSPQRPARPPLWASGMAKGGNALAVQALRGRLGGLGRRERSGRNIDWVICGLDRGFGQRAGYSGWLYSIESCRFGLFWSGVTTLYTTLPTSQADTTIKA